ISFIPALLVAMLFSVHSNSFAANLPSMSSNGLHSIIGEPNIIVADVRDAAPFAQEHIPGATNVPYLMVKTTTAFSANGTIVLYCGNDTCPTSRIAAQDLVNAGHKNVYVLEGGLEKWKQSYPTEGTAVLAHNSGPASSKIIYPEVLARQLNSGTYLVIDTRPSNEFKAAHLPGAKNVQPELLSTLEVAQDIVPVVCDRDASRAAKALDGLRARGFKALELSGGIAAWTGKKLPLAAGVK
ncbi:MAG TPA: rhodanese-like domain-containing protein, partial [Elusimicrobiales bacterium]|nr:rhodanese-like domain-containing protein [Elusimicrobiales bacterium]